MREAWTDERVDDLASEVHRGFERVDTELRELRDRIDAMQRTMILGFVTVLAGIVATQL